MHYDVVASERPIYTEVGDGRSLFEARADGPMHGDLSGSITFQYSQVLLPKPPGVAIAQALPGRVAALFTITHGEDRLQGAGTGMFYTELDASGNGHGRYQASGHVLSVTVGVVDFFLARVYIEDEVKMVEGTGTGARGTMRLEIARS